MLLVWSVNCRGSIKPQHHWHWALLHRLQFLAKVGSATLKNPSVSLWFASFTAQNCAMAPALQSDGVTNRSFFQCMTLLLASGIGSGVLVFLGWSSAEPKGTFLQCQRANNSLQHSFDKDSKSYGIGWLHARCVVFLHWSIGIWCDYMDPIFGSAARDPRKAWTKFFS